MLFDHMSIADRVKLVDIIDGLDGPTPKALELRADLTASVLAELPNLETTSET
jgi:hypothetical protein